MPDPSFPFEQRHERWSRRRRDRATRPPTLGDELTNSPKIQVRLAEYWVVFPTRTTEEECATKDKFWRIFSLWVFRVNPFFNTKESPWKIWCYAKSCWDSFQVLWWRIFQPKKPARVSRKFPCHCHLANQIEIGLNNNHYSSSQQPWQ